MHPYCQPASPASSLSVSSFFAAKLDSTCFNHKSTGRRRHSSSALSKPCTVRISAMERAVGRSKSHASRNLYLPRGPGQTDNDLARLRPTAQVTNHIYRPAAKTSAICGEMFYKFIQQRFEVREHILNVPTPCLLMPVRCAVLQEPGDFLIAIPSSQSVSFIDFL
jgi:hypothetical protein